MADTPSVLGRRYLPFLAVIGVQVLLAAVAPSKGILSSGGAAAGTGATSNVAAGTSGGSGSSGSGAASGGAGGTSGGSGSGASTGGAGATGGGGASGGGGTSGGGATSGGLASGSSGSGASSPAAQASTDRSDCNRTGSQIGPPGYVYMPPCVPVWHGGNNGGATMQGVTATTINVVFYKAQANAEVNAILGTQGLAATTGQSCAADEAFLNVINRYWTLYGRHVVSLDGPGGNSGKAQQGCGGFPYFQSECPLTPPDPACDAAEAKVVAAMHPAVLVGGPDVFFTQALIPFHILQITGGELPESYYQADSPYVLGVLMDGQRQADFDAEYWCKKLNDQAANYAGTDVKQGRNWGHGTIPIRKVAILFPVNAGDESSEIPANEFKADLTGGMCNSPGGVTEFSYASDITTAQQQTSTIVAELIQDHITTVACWCDPIAPVFLTEGMLAQSYYPEQFMLGVGLIDYDVLGRLYVSAEWSHAFGVSDLALSQPFAESDAVHWYNAGGMGGEPDATENAAVPGFSLLASAFQQAGPEPTTQGLVNGLQSLPVFGGWARYHDPTLLQIAFKQPDPYTAAEDVREVYWNSTRPSEVDGKPGSYCPVNGGERYLPGQFSPGVSELFNKAQNGC